MNASQRPWIEKGYQVFAYEGPGGLKVERLAKGIGKNKSSFYHHFADLEIFTSLLVDHHLSQAYIMAEKEMNAANLEELIDIIHDHKIDLLFNRQLRVHREVKEFETCFMKTNEITGKAMAGIWAQAIGLQDNSYLANLVLKLSLENFFLQITDETLNPDWLHNYFQELRRLVQAFKNSDSLASLDGSV